MGLILDSSAVIAAERRGQAVPNFLELVKASFGEQQIAISAVGLAELVHGIYRASTSEQRTRRQHFVDDLRMVVPILPLNEEAGLIAGRLDGEQQAKGNVIPFVDLLIAATALAFGYSVVTVNSRHFKQVPGLTVLTF